MAGPAVAAAALAVVPDRGRPLFAWGPRWPTSTIAHSATELRPTDGAASGSGGHRARAAGPTATQSKRCSASIGGRLVSRFSVESMRTGRLAGICVGGRAERRVQERKMDDNESGTNAKKGF